MPYAPDLAGCALDGRYELHELIGEGTFGRVYRGYDRRLARPVAIKVIKPWWAEDPNGAESFEREAQLLARVSDPGIVQIFDVGQAEEGLYFVTELVEGESLAARLKRGGPLPAWEACDIAEQLCRALEHAHAEHIVHRDIKPANVLMSARGQVKVGDLGIARLAEGSTDGGTATVVGTPRYMAPEQASGQPVTAATDVYSAGIVLYEMLAGRTPFGGESAVEIALQHVQMQPPPLPSETPRSLGRVIVRALAKDPADRYQSAVAMADALARAREGAGASASQTDTPAPDAEWWEAPTEVGDATTEIFARDTRTLPRAGRVDPTRPAPRMSPRRTVNPAARRRTVAVFALTLAVLAALLLAARALTAPPTEALPQLHGLTAGQVAGKLTSRAPARRVHARVQPGEAWHRVRPEPGPRHAGQAGVDDLGRDQQRPATGRSAATHRQELGDRHRDPSQSRPQRQRHERARAWHQSRHRRPATAHGRAPPQAAGHGGAVRRRGAELARGDLVQRRRRRRSLGPVPGPGQPVADRLQHVLQRQPATSCSSATARARRCSGSDPTRRTSRST